MTRIGINIGIDYTITGVIERGEYGIAVGFQKFGEKTKWCTWEYCIESTNDYYHGHYMMPDESTAWTDAINRLYLCIFRNLKHDLSEYTGERKSQ